MRQPDWFRLSSMPTQAPWQHKATFFIVISAAGTFLTLIVLIFDGWVTALAIYIICSLLLAILLSQLAAQQEKLHAKPTADDAASKHSNSQLGIIFKRLSGFWSKDAVRPRDANEPVSPPVLSKITSTD